MSCVTSAAVYTRGDARESVLAGSREVAGLPNSEWAEPQNKWERAGSLAGRRDDDIIGTRRRASRPEERERGALVVVLKGLLWGSPGP
ncbi:unnamed protein product [Lota lota]